MRNQEKRLKLVGKLKIQEDQWGFCPDGRRVDQLLPLQNGAVWIWINPHLGFSGKFKGKTSELVQTQQCLLRYLTIVVNSLPALHMVRKTQKKIDGTYRQVYFIIILRCQCCFCYNASLMTSPPGPCVSWNSWRSLSMAATGPTQWPPHLELTLRRSWRNTPRCLLTMQALMSRCLESVCSFQRPPAALKHHPKPSNVRPTLTFHGPYPALISICLISLHNLG